MTPEQVLSHKPRVLTQKQREHYFAEGYLLLEKIIPDEWIQRLRAATDELIERSRKVTKADAVWDLEPGHRADAPRLRRVSAPVDQHPAYWDYISQSLVGDIVAESTSSGRTAARR
jgi:ectoine hydroxylase